MWHPKGAIVRKLMEDYSRSRHERGGYEFVFTPHLTKSSCSRRRGHLDWYADGMYPPMEMDNGTYYMKPMNCPMHCLIFTSRQRSYRELPLRLFELGTVYRYERAGVAPRAPADRGLHAGRQPHLLHGGTTADELAPLLELRAVRAARLRLQRLPGLPLDARPREVDRQRSQIEQLREGRDRLLGAYEVVQRTIDHAVEALRVSAPEAHTVAAPEPVALAAGADADTEEQPSEGVRALDAARAA